MPNDEILIETEDSGKVPAEDLQGLVEDVRNIGQDASVAYPAPIRLPPGYYHLPDLLAVPWDEVFIWIGSRASEAVITQVVGVAVSWMRERFRKKPDRKFLSLTGEEEVRIPQAVWIIRDEGDKGSVVERVELKSPDAKPVRLRPKDFGTYTRTKPLRTPPKDE